MRLSSYNLKASKRETLYQTMENIASSSSGSQRFRWVQKTIKQNCWGKKM